MHVGRTRLPQVCTTKRGSRQSNCYELCHLQYFVFHKEKGCSKLQFIACQVCLTEVWNDKNPSFVPFQSSLFPQCHEILWEVRSTGWYLDATGKVAAVSPPCYLWAQ